MRDDDDAATTTNELGEAATGVAIGRARPGTLTGERYRLRSEIGHGGMGEVIAATDEKIGREVAVKRMKDEEPSERAMGRFFREALIQGRLQHPAIVPVHDLGVDENGRPFFTMKRVVGATMAQLIQDPAQTQRLLRAFVDVCLAVEFAHSRGVVHRDLKPSNIVLGDFGDVYVLDWGAAKLLGDTEVASVAQTTDSEEDVTLEGTVLGTRGYMSPEQALAWPDVDARTDVFALGCVLFEILVGDRMNPTREAKDTDPRGSRPSLHPSARDVPPELDTLVKLATIHAREMRLATPRELGESVQRFLDGDRDLAQRQALAREHLEKARAAFDDGAWRDAMRDAGRALALDPKLEGAAELVTRLMLEPPEVQPAEVTRAIAVDNVETLKRHARSGAMGYLGFLALLPMLVLGERVQLGYAAMLVGAIALNVWLLVSRWSYRNLRWRTVRIALGNILLVTVVARMTSPFLFAPAIATLATTVMVLSPTYDRPRSVLLLVAGMTAALTLLHAAEFSGVLSRSTEMIAGGIALTPPALQLSDAAKQIVLVLATLGLIAAAGGTAYANRRAERSVRDRLHMQAWQLRQLVA